MKRTTIRTSRQAAVAFDRKQNSARQSRAARIQLRHTVELLLGSQVELAFVPGGLFVAGRLLVRCCLLLGG